jgi:hypothetical protein
LIALCGHTTLRQRAPMIGRGGAFVDDVIIQDKGGRLAYHQLKSGMKTRWSRPLEADFRCQLRCCKASRRQSDLLLVVPGEALAGALRKSKPSGLGRVTVVAFPACSSIQELCGLPPVANDLASLCAVPDNTRLRHIAEAIQMWWLDAVKAATMHSLDDLRNYLWSHESLLVSHPARRKSSDWTAAQRILAGIPGLRVTETGGYLHYAYGSTDQGVIGRCDRPAYRRFLRRVLAQRPSTFDDFEKLL